jgi:hypothetical protein
VAPAGDTVKRCGLFAAQQTRSVALAGAKQAQSIDFGETKPFGRLATTAKYFI